MRSNVAVKTTQAWHSFGFNAHKKQRYMVHIKHFEDAYSQSREHFFLDLLKQQGAPVPQVIKNDIQNKAIHMTHVGIDLRKWLLGLHANMLDQSRAMRVLHESLVCCQKISQLGVWHLDLASRNFMVSELSARSHPVIHIIDFSLATSPQFLLQKPLWIRPHADQHHLTLQRAVTQDWDTFFKQAQLAPPPRYDLEFEIPIEDYAKTWLNQLAVDQLSHPWCVIAHSVGNLLVEASATPCFEASVRQQLQQLGHAAKNINLESDALAQIAHIMSFLVSPISNETPRPRAKHATVNVEEPTPTSVTAVLASENSPLTLEEPTALSKPANESKLWPLVFLITVVVAGYALADVLFWTYKLMISTSSTLTLLGVFFVSALMLLMAMFSKQAYLWLFRAAQWHSLSLAALGLDLWVRDATQYWFYVFLGLSIFTAWNGQKNARTSPSITNQHKESEV